jgi:ADP-heptose:LPS heptosyltransferase
MEIATPTKILIVSLLRLEDILLSTAILRSLNRQYPKAELHILINGQYKAVTPLIPYATKVHSFDRNEMLLEEFAATLREENYDRVINLTHNHLSAWLAALIGCPQTQGPIFRSEGRIASNSKWFDSLSGVHPDNRFHCVDVFHYGAGLLTSDRRIELCESAAGKAFAQSIFKDDSNEKILIDAGGLTVSDWKKIIVMVKQSQPQARVFALGLTDEKSVVEEICKDCDSTPVIGDLSELFSVISASHFLITSRQTLKYFASATKIRILEIAPEGSEFQKTGAYSPNAIIVQSKSSKVEHALLSLICKAMMNHDENGLRALAHEFVSEANIFRTHINIYGDWAAYGIGHAFTQTEIVSWLDRSSSKLFLEQVFTKPVGEYGSEGLELQHLLKSIFPDQTWREWVSELGHIEKQVHWFEIQIVSYLTKLKEVLLSIETGEVLKAYISELRNFCESVEKSPVYSTYAMQLSTVTDLIAPHTQVFPIVKRIREELTISHQRVKIELKLIRNLQTGFMEVL